MEKISFTHGGEEYDSKYPEGIPTSIRITTSDGKVLDSGLVMFPAGHARNSTADLKVRSLNLPTPPVRLFSLSHTIPPCLIPSSHSTHNTIQAILNNKFRRLARLSSDTVEDFLKRFENLTEKSAEEIDGMYGDLELKMHPEFKGKL